MYEGEHFNGISHLVGAVLALIGGRRAAFPGRCQRRDGLAIPIGGKTGTGDNRFDVFGHGGALIKSRVVSRTATFVFFIGGHFYGTLTAYVPGQDAGRYNFTSALPVQILKTLAPTLAPIVGAAEGAPVHSAPERMPEGGEAPDEALPPMPLEDLT